MKADKQRHNGKLSEKDTISVKIVVQEMINV